MTNTVPDDSVDPTANQQTGRPDELEDWLTDLRVTLNDDPPDWLTPEDDTADAAPGPAAPPPTDTPPQSAPPDENAKDHGATPAVGRHRAAQ
jgi:hypothetical protein